MACDLAECTRDEIDDIMWRNGERLFGAKHREFVGAHPEPLHYMLPSSKQPKF